MQHDRHVWTFRWFRAYVGRDTNIPLADHVRAFLLFTGVR